MPANPVMSAATLTAGLRAEFSNTYESSYKAATEILGKVMQLGIPTSTRTTPFAYYATAPYPQYWPYGQNIPEAQFDSVGYNVTARRFANRVPYLHDDLHDDQLRQLMSRVRSLAEHYGTLHERIFFQILNGAADPALLPAVPTAPDGAAFFATVAAGAARFGVTGGNIVTGNGVADVSSILTDFYNAKERFYQMQDTQGQPLWDPSVLDKEYVVVLPAAQLEVFLRAFRGTIIQGDFAGISNLTRDVSENITLWPTQRITTNDWYVFLAGSSLKPVAQLDLESLYVNEGNQQNSDSARTTGIEYFQAVARYGYTVNLPYGAIQIDN